MSEKKADGKQQPLNADRRKLTRNALLGGGLIGAGATQKIWTKPVIQSAVLPAHAEPSEITCPVVSAG